MTFQCELTDTNGVRQVSLSGRLDSATSGDFEKHLQTLFESSGARALMDFSSLDYISSAGLRVVLMAAKRAKQAQGRLVLCGLQPHVKDVFEISGFLKILTVADDPVSALSHLNA
ncbi:STAS domain-containing protein [Paraburkholderia lacunae]|uniref:Anti-sigma factor antagonist n=1 Tax=Paraburkholderia lacunae TaxID=2211104 RepID=A0A370NET7_9BURK|nr:STAS domain-containing protein [Paraburkholderia lacunae]RDK04114.1 anti-sigma factor antagonist [Paraburkholderia lacunae]